MRIFVLSLAFAVCGSASAQAQAQMQPVRQTEVLDPWGRHADEGTALPDDVVRDGDVADPNPSMSAREAALTREANGVTARLRACLGEGEGIFRYRLTLSPTRVSRGRFAPCVQRALRAAQLSGRGTYELVLQRRENHTRAFVVDRAARRRARQRPTQPSRPAQPVQPAQPSMACATPMLQAAARRTGDDQSFPDFVGMRVEAVLRHRTGPIAEAACSGLRNEVLDPWPNRDPRTAPPNAFEREWTRRVRQRAVLILACIPSEQRPESWALSFQVDSNGNVSALHEATQAMAECIQRRIDPPPRPYQLHVSFGETPAALYVDTR